MSHEWFLKNTNKDCTNIYGSKRAAKSHTFNIKRNLQLPNLNLQHNTSSQILATQLKGCYPHCNAILGQYSSPGVPPWAGTLQASGSLIHRVNFSPHPCTRPFSITWPRITHTVFQITQHMALSMSGLHSRGKICRHAQQNSLTFIPASISLLQPSFHYFILSIVCKTSFKGRKYSIFSFLSISYIHNRL